MEKINTDNLEKALDKPVPQISKAPQAYTKEAREPLRGPEESSQKILTEGKEEIGFHKGALNTLANERNELFKMMQNVEAIMQAHLKRLEELGVKIEQKK